MLAISVVVIIIGSAAFVLTSVGKNEAKNEEIATDSVDADSANTGEVATPIRGDTGAVVSVPFDFDLAGAVDAPYATPNPDLGIRNVRQRLYRGYCGPEAQLESTLQTFRARKEAIYSLYRGEERLESWRADQMVSYLDEFYETIEDPSKVQRRLIRRCRRGPSS